MGIFDKVGETINTTADKAKSISELSNLKKRLQYEEERIEEIFSEIGKKYFEEPIQNKKLLDSLCEDIITRQKRIKRMNFELNELKGIKVCEHCGTQIDEKFMFCGVCGAKLPSFVDDKDSDSKTDYKEVEKYLNLGKA
ncbi:MAG TPA: zinc ribbon domain-containing protein [Oscillospiraceae bacterium]|nr:zinc ribbon domain-containing protein [Oscillospiraceae bacterium]